MEWSPTQIRDFRSALISWYRSQRRDLPWRRNSDPYAIWVSEVMLQQTQVATVLPYYERFLERFPKLEDLAQAPESEVLALWSGLGYYRRAKMLQRGARHVLEENGGALPREAAKLQEIPGIGAYTAGAIASIAFGEAAPLVDGNVVRVYARIFALSGHAREAALQRRIWEEAAILVDPRHPGDFNQALMELGATLCRKSEPRCLICPVRDFCAAQRLGKTSVYPATPPAPELKILTRLVALVRSGPEILLTRSVKPQWFENMWLLPHWYVDAEAATADKLLDLMKKDWKLSPAALQARGLSRHGITQHRITSHIYALELKKSDLEKQLKKETETRWASVQELAALPIPNFERKILAKIPDIG